MTIRITKPEIEAIVNLRLQTGAFKDADDVILQALKASPSPQPVPVPTGSLLEVFQEIRGLADDVDFARSPSCGRPVDIR